jgi:hypothetical protein
VKEEETGAVRRAKRNRTTKPKKKSGKARKRDRTKKQRSVTA